MRGIIAHNFYEVKLPSGENSAVKRYQQILQSFCEEVVPFFRYSDSIREMSFRQKTEILLSASKLQRVNREFSKLILTTKFDFLNFHNLFPLIGTGILDQARRNRIKTIYSVHNYRFQCLQGSNFRNGRVCVKCVDRGDLSWGVAKSCYRSSMVLSLSMRAKIENLRNKFTDIDAFIVLSTHSADSLISLGVDSRKIFVDSPSLKRTSLKNSSQNKTLLFVGRLDELKGVKWLCQTWLQSRISKSGWNLKVIGSGPVYHELLSLSKGQPSITILGQMSPDEVSHEISDCSLVCIPSQGFEGYPLIIPEALSQGKPILANKLGSLQSILKPDFTVFFENKTSSLLSTLDSLTNVNLELLSKAAYRYFLENLQDEIRQNRVKKMYDEIIK